MQVHVDGDVVLFRAGFGAEHTEYLVSYRDEQFDEDVVINCRYKKDAVEVVKGLTERDIEAEIEAIQILEPLANALHNVKTILTSIVNTLGADPSDVTVWLSGPSEQNYRRQVATIKEYKGNRKDARRPTYEKEIRDYIMQRFNGKITVGQEADDAMGIAQMAVSFGQSCIVTNDKDLDMIPGLHYNFVTDEKYVVDDQTATWLFYSQLLKGDSTDNIMGVPGIGDKKAYDALEEIWQDEAAMQETAWALYVQGYGFAAYPALVENGRLLWIRRQEEELWTPIKCTT